MLNLTRKKGEAVTIRFQNQEVELVILEIKGNHVKLGFEHSPDVIVLRQEICKRIEAQNKAAASADPADFNNILNLKNIP